MWKLGWMYENGYGVPQVSTFSTYEFLETEHGTGFPRHYDFSLKPNMEACLLVSLSVFRLHARSLWHTLTVRGGDPSLWSSNVADSGKSYAVELQLK